MEQVYCVHCKNRTNTSNIEYKVSKNIKDMIQGNSVKPSKRNSIHLRSQC